MADNSNYQLATPEDFNKFRNACDSTENWNVCYEEGEDLKVWDQKVKLFASLLLLLVTRAILAQFEYDAVINCVTTIHL
jgi:hypothetical protein